MQSVLSCARPPLAVTPTHMSIPPPEVSKVDTVSVWCDGSTDIRSGKLYRAASLGHPKVYLKIDGHGYVDCGYCDRRFVLEGGPADGVDQAALRDISEGADPGHP